MSGAVERPQGDAVAPIVVLVVMHTAERSGAPIAMLRLMRWCVASQRVKPIFLFATGGPLLDDFAELGPCIDLHYERVRNLTWPKLRGDRLGEPPPTLRRRGLRAVAATYARRHRVEVVLTNSAAAVELAAQLPSSIPHVTYLHEMPTLVEWFLGPDGITRIRAASDHVLVVSDAVARQFADGEASTIGVTKLPGAVDIEPELTPEQREQLRAATLHAPARSTVVVGCGPPGLVKGTDLFLHVARQVAQSGAHEEIVFRWIGLRPDDPGSVALASEVERDPALVNTRILPNVPDARRVLAAADVYLSPSREDANPLTVLEAAAAGVPTVCFEGAGGAEELVAAGGGLAVPYLDVDAMSAQTIRLADDPDLRRKLGSQAKAAVAADNAVGVLGSRLLEVLRLVVA